MAAPPSIAEQSATAESTPHHKAVVFEDVSISFESGKLLDGISFELARGETKVLLGVAGSGKTTILKLTLGLLKPDSGHIHVLGYDVTRMKEDDLFDLRRHIGMVFQESALFDSLNVRDNVAYRLMEEDLPPEEIDERVRESLRFVELEHTINMYPSELSGGMRRRVAIARAIITQPEVLLYDSPTGGLDPITSTNIIEQIVKQRDFYKTSALMVTHRLQDAFVMASHYYDADAHEMRPIEGTSHTAVNTTFLILRDGKIIFDGNVFELGQVRDEYIREYIS
jgi:phospholipid/cholesterol/gamma-HCH transport system ATP-binding protein